MIRVYNLPEPKKEKAHIDQMWAVKTGFERASVYLSMKYSMLTTAFAFFFMDEVSLMP